jgi:inosine/xanthosine triphosphatase
MPSIALASKNLAKIEATLNGFKKMFPESTFIVEPRSVESRVRSQPISTAETLHGATNRLHRIRELVADADYYVAIEGGIEDKDGEVQVFAWILVQSQNYISKSQTARFRLPNEVAELIRRGQNMGDASQRILPVDHLSFQGGSVGILTSQVIDRAAFYEHAIILALIPFKNASLYHLHIT